MHRKATPLKPNAPALSIIPTNNAPTNTPKSTLPSNTTPSTNRKLSTNHKPNSPSDPSMRTTLQNLDLFPMAKQHFPALTSSQPRESTRARKATTRFLDGKNATYLPRLASALGVGLTHNNDIAGAGADDDTAPSFDSAMNLDGYQAPTSAMTIPEASMFSALEPRRSERARQASKRFLEGEMGARMPRLSAALGVATSDR